MDDLQLVVESLDSVDTSLRGAYVPTDDGKHKFDLSKYQEIVTKPVRDSQRKILDEKKQIQQQMQRFDAFKDLSDDDIAELIERRAKGDQGGNQPNAADLVKKAVDAAKKEYGEKLTAKEQEVAALIGSFQSKEINERLVKLAIKAGMPEDAIADFVEGRWRNRFGLEGFDIKNPNKADFVFYEADGTPSHLSPEDAVRQVIRKESPRLFGPNDKGGSGAPPNAGRGGNAGAKTITRAQFDAMQPDEKMKFVKSGGKMTD